MGKDGTLVLDLLDVYGNYLGEAVDITLRNFTLTSANFRDSSRKAKGQIRFKGLESEPNGVYQLTVYPMSYYPVSRIVTVPSGGSRSVMLTFPVDPRKIQKVVFPPYTGLLDPAKSLLEASPAVLGQEGKTGQALYDNLPDLSRAGLLNIAAKTGRTRLSNGEPVISYFRELTEIRGDRFFVKVSQALREEVKNSVGQGLFYPASELLHRPPEGFDQAGSWKTQDTYGNLQLSFFASSNEWRADVDIDNAAGLEHVFQVARNALTGPTSPYDIHEILLAFQELDPGYRFVL